MQIVLLLLLAITIVIFFIIMFTASSVETGKGSGLGPETAVKEALSSLDEVVMGVDTFLEMKEKIRKNDASKLIEHKERIVQNTLLENNISGGVNSETIESLKKTCRELRIMLTKMTKSYSEKKDIMNIIDNLKNKVSYADTRLTFLIKNA